MGKQKIFNFFGGNVFALTNDDVFEATSDTDESFGVDDTKVSPVSNVISAARETGLIKLDDSESFSPRYARYLPFWA